MAESNARSLLIMLMPSLLPVQQRIVSSSIAAHISKWILILYAGGDDFECGVGGCGGGWMQAKALATLPQRSWSAKGMQNGTLASSIPSTVLNGGLVLSNTCDASYHNFIHTTQHEAALAPGPICQKSTGVVTVDGGAAPQASNM